MNFLSPAFLWALPLVAAPVLIHLLARRQRRTLRWGAMEFLFACPAPRRRFMRLKDLLLLLLRMAVVLAIVGALAQPMISTGKFGAKGPRDVILILDNSMAASRKIIGGTVYDRELTEASHLLNDLGEADMVRILLTSPRPEWLNDSPLSGSKANSRGLLESLRRLAPTQAGADFLECAQEAAKADAAGQDMSRFAVIVASHNARPWKSEAAMQWSSLTARAKKATPPIFFGANLVPDEPVKFSNLTVESLVTQRAKIAPGQVVTLAASIRNTGAGPSQPTTLAWSALGQALGVSAVPALAAGAGTVVNLSQSFDMPGNIDVSCRLNVEDDLPSDDAAHCLLDVSGRVPVLIVQGEPQSDPTQSETSYFLAALGVGRNMQDSNAISLFQPKLIGYREVDGEDLTRYSCVVLADVPRLSAEQAQRLGRFVSACGGLWVALGEQTDARAFNLILADPKTGLSPLRLIKAVGETGERQTFTGLAPPSAENPATALLSDLQRLDVDKVRIYRRYQFDTVGAAPVSTLLRMEGGAPLVVEKALGRGSVIVQGIPLGLAWSSFPLCQSYVVMVNEWLWHLAAPGQTKRNLQPGELLDTTRSREFCDGAASLQLPEGRKLPLVGDEAEGRVTFRYAKTFGPGEYRLTISGAPSASAVELFNVSRDPEQSDLTPLSEKQMKSLSESGGVNFKSDPLAQPRGIHSGPAAHREVSDVVLLALTALMASELAAAFWLSRRRLVKAAPVAMEPAMRT